MPSLYCVWSADGNLPPRYVFWWRFHWKIALTLRHWDGFCWFLCLNARARSKIAIVEIIPGKPVVTWRAIHSKNRFRFDIRIFLAPELGSVVKMSGQWFSLTIKLRQVIVELSRKIVEWRQKGRCSRTDMIGKQTAGQNLGYCTEDQLGDNWWFAIFLPS